MAHLPARIHLTGRWPPQPRRMPRAMIIMLALAVLLDLDLLARVLAADDAHDTLLMLFAGLWIDLTVMCALADLAMCTPRWSPMLPVILLPLAGAAFFAAAMMSAHAPLALAVSVMLPPIIVLAALWPWLTRWHARLAVPRMLALCWSAVLALSLATLLSAA